ncbi:DUF3280 domain-containing protein [Methylobacillus gramineus]|uniref:DUF2380 domain-containing protein n=1 Tax=Methylobacillus gramineus TaxID=755169 RepID=UPI001CFF6A71|nr:DUF2380 domain-containing protein [Methylobacillus gramineus]MCB5185015.1 DUF3280 domain-containing protein [Methylobacillus gramineus]
MHKIINTLVLLLVCSMVNTETVAGESPKVVVMAFTLNDMTNLPDAPEELKRIALLSAKFLESLKSKDVNVVPSGRDVEAEVEKHSPTYLYDNVETAIELNKDTGADYLVIGTALKPTYLFVYPRLIIIDVKKCMVVLSKAAQLESSWSDENTTIRTAEKLAQVVKDRLDALHAAERNK